MIAGFERPTAGGPARRPGLVGDAAARARRSTPSSELRAVPAPRGARQRRVRPALPEGRPGERTGAWMRRSSWSSSVNGSAARAALRRPARRVAARRRAGAGGASELTELDQIEGLLHPAPAPHGRPSGSGGRRRRCRTDKVREQRVALEDGVDVAALGRDGREVGAVEQDLARGRALEAGDQPQRRRLAAARRPQQREELARPDREVDAVDRGDRRQRSWSGPSAPPRLPSRAVGADRDRLLLPVAISFPSPSAPASPSRASRTRFGSRTSAGRGRAADPIRVVTTMIVATALSAGVVAPPRAFE